MSEMGLETYCGNLGSAACEPGTLVVRACVTFNSKVFLNGVRAACAKKCVHINETKVPQKLF